MDNLERKIKEAAKIYESIEIPNELDGIIKNQIKKYNSKRRMLEMLKKTIALTAAAAAAFVITINSSSAVAYALYEMPIIGNFARVITFREYKYVDDVQDVNVKVPVVKDTGNENLEAKINTEIQQKMDAIIAEAEQKAAEYKKAFLETGGKEEDFVQRPIFADFEKKYSDENVLSFIINSVQVVGNSDSQTYFYNIDLKTGKSLKISDVLGENYKQLADESIQKQIDEQNKENGDMPLYFNGENGVEGFSGINEDQTFFINENGEVVVKFAKYEIAPGYLGMPEFVVGKMIQK